MFKKGNNFDRVKQRFSLRKLNVGVCSVLLGLTFMSGNYNTVKSDTTQNPTKLEESKATDQSQTGPTHPQRDASVAVKNNANDAEFSNATNPINSGNSDTVKADTTQNPTKLEESKATDQSQTGPTHPQRVVVDASVAVKNNANDASATNHINSGNSDNGGSDLSEVGLKGIKQNNNGTETVNTAKIADQTIANTFAAYEASLLEIDPNPSHDSSDNNTETNSRSTIIGLNEYSNPKHLGKVTEKLSDTARSIKQVNITPDELKPTLLDETGKAVENTSKELNFDLMLTSQSNQTQVL